MAVPIFLNGFDISQATCTINGIPCAESVHDYYEAADRQSGPDLSKTYYCNWTDRFKVANAALGLNSVVGGRGGVVSFGIPLQHPEILAAYCSSVRITGKGRPYQGPYQIAWPVAAIQIGFKAYPWSFQGFDDPENLQSIDPATSFVYATQEIDQGEETIEVPATAILRGGGAVASATGMTIPWAHAIMRITFERLPYMPVNTLPFYNYLNNGTFMGCQKGQVQFKGSHTNRVQQTDGTTTQTVTNTYRYRYIPQQGSVYPDWNYYINPDVAGAANLWELRTWNTAGNPPIFPYGDLTQTFPPGYLQ